jgi:predicted methyltransferase
MRTSRLSIVLAMSFLVVGSAALAAPAPDPALAAAVASPARPATAVARDKARHPVEELTFFGLTPTMTVVEIWPGGGYWTDILGPYLAKGGHYYLALPVPGNAEEDAGVKRFKERIAGEKDRLGTLNETLLGTGHFDIAPPGSADLVVTFRNFHNWMEEGYADQALAGAFKALKPGGILGIEDHRGRNDQPQDPKAKSGYVRQDYTIAAAKKAGFEYVGASEVNANPRDTKDSAAASRRRPPNPWCPSGWH